MIYTIKTHFINKNNRDTTKNIFSPNSERQKMLKPLLINKKKYDKFIFLCEVDIVATSDNEQSV